MESTDKYARAKEELDDLFTALLDEDEDDSWPELHLLVERFDGLSLSFQEVVNGIEEREYLIAIHCRDLSPPAAVHERYHEVTDKLLGDVVVAFSSIKTFLNAVANFIVGSVGQSRLRGIRPKSFGSLVESAVKESAHQHELGQLLELLATAGVAYEDTYMQYRDKHIEHPRNLARRSIRHGPKTQVIHERGVKQRGSKKVQPLPPLVPINKVVVALRPPNDGSVHMFHIRPAVAAGALVNRGDTLGAVYDDTGSHFGRWGSHSHRFATPDAPDSAVGGDLEGPNYLHESPDPVEAMIDLMSLTAQVVRFVKDARTA